VFDVETTTKHKGNPYCPSNHLVSFSVLTEQGNPTFYYGNDPSFCTRLREILARATLLIGVNLKFDIAWAKRYKAVIPKGFSIWDCQLAEFILSGQTNSFASMESLCKLYNIPGKEDAVAQYWAQGIDTPDIPVEVLKEYGNGDVERTWQIYQAQLNDPRMTPALNRLILLDGLDLLVLQKMEENGLKYDSDTSRNEAERLRNELNECDAFLLGLADVPINLNSGRQLSAFLYGGSWDEDIYEPVTRIYKSGPRKGEEHVQNRFVETKTYTLKGFFRPLARTELKESTEERKVWSTAEPILKQLNARSKFQRSIIEKLLRRAELSKLIETYFVNLPALIDEMEWGEYVHGQYNQVVARTGRLSSSKPNMQNNPSEVDRMFVSRYAD
jgi:DNA polymerase I-like protein with 3'-5' exonuclease and polymerase domains